MAKQTQQLAEEQNSQADTQTDTQDDTALHPDQTHWSIDNLPSVLYALRPGIQYIKSRARVRETTHQIFTKHVRDFPVLPSRISSKVEGWRLEAWFRLDRRLEAQDILDRVSPRFRGTVSTLDIELRREEFRRLFYVADWKSQVSINEVARVVHRAGVDLGLNTTRGVTPGLVDPERGEEGGRIPVPKRRGKVAVTSWPFFVMQGVRKQAMTSEACFWPSGSKGYPLLQGEVQPRQTALPSPKKWMEDCFERVKHKPRRPSAATYPEQCELASHHNSLVFREASDDRGTMTLEEYLNRNRMSYEEYLCRDESGRGRRGMNRADNGFTRRDVVDPWLSCCN